MSAIALCSVCGSPLHTDGTCKVCAGSYLEKMTAPRELTPDDEHVRMISDILRAEAKAAVLTPPFGNNPVSNAYVLGLLRAIEIAEQEGA